jgi:hypothetical protein
MFEADKGRFTVRQCAFCMILSLSVGSLLFQVYFLHFSGSRPVDAEPVHQEQRCTSALAFTNVDPQTLALNSDSTRFGLWPDRFCLHGVSFHFQLDSDPLSRSMA